MTRDVEGPRSAAARDDSGPYTDGAAEKHAEELLRLRRALKAADKRIAALEGWLTVQCGQAVARAGRRPWRLPVLPFELVWISIRWHMRRRRKIPGSGSVEDVLLAIRRHDEETSDRTGA